MTVPAAPVDVADKAPLLDVAYHHEQYWHADQSDWIKSLLLFFDGVAVLVPDYMRDRPLFTDPTLAQPLADHGLLNRLSPETLVDQHTAEALTELLDDLLSADAFDGLDRDTAFAEISNSRLGGTADAGLTEVVLEQLRERGLARPTVDGVSIPLHPAVRAYARDLRQFVRDAAALNQADQPQAFLDRREALADAADELRRLARTSWRRPLATFGLGIAGSAVTLAYGNPIGAGLTAAGALLGLRRQADPASAYTYLFQAQQHLSAQHRR